MRVLFEEYGSSLLSAIAGIVVLNIFVSLVLGNSLKINAQVVQNSISDHVPKDTYVVGIDKDSFVVKNLVVLKNSDIDYNSLCYAANENGEDISSFISVYKKADTSIAGKQEVRFLLHYNGETMLGISDVYVCNEDEVLSSEEYD